MCPKGGPDGKPLCIDRSQLCDGKPDCEDDADEEAACCKYLLFFPSLINLRYPINYREPRVRIKFEVSSIFNNEISVSVAVKIAA